MEKKNYKTVEQHLKKVLSYDVFMKAVQYINKEKLQKKIKNPYLAIQDAFIWSDTLEGGKYWSKIADTIKP